ncbi:hypothetical protein ACKLNR_015134 [Fusarium oxysporum f. sp. zingiberi]
MSSGELSVIWAAPTAPLTTSIRRVAFPTLSDWYADVASSLASPALSWWACVDKSAGEAYLASLFSLKTREHFRKVILMLDSDGLFYDADSYMNPTICDTLLDNLSILGIVIEQPEPAHPYRAGRDNMNDEKEEWRAWLTTTLEYINQAIPNDAKVVVDTNKMTDATEIVERAMSGRCNFQDLRDGDRVFERAEYSYTGGYWDDDHGPTSCRDIIDDCDYDYYYSD